jgi:hypothetical protein
MSQMSFDGFRSHERRLVRLVIRCAVRMVIVRRVFGIKVELGLALRLRRCRTSL